MAEPLARKAQKAPLGRAAEKNLGDGKRDELSCGDPRPAARTAPGRQEIVHQHVKCGEQAVEVGVHEATSVVDVAEATSTFDSPRTSPRATRPRAIPASNSESLI